MVKIVGVLVSEENNLMWMAYTEDKAIVFDATHPDIVEKLLEIEIDGNLMSIEAVNSASKIKGNKRNLLAIWTTHYHLDHSKGNDYFRNRCKVYDRINLVEEIVQLDEFKVEGLATPCHTEDSFCFLLNDSFLLTGDTVIFLGCGKFFEGTADDMQKCFDKLKKKVPDAALCCYGHESSAKGYEFAKQYFKDLPEEFANRKLLTFEEEKKWNVFMNCDKLVDNGDVFDLADLRDIKNQF